MLSSLLGVGAIIALLMLPGTTADCNTPAWLPYTSNPMLDTNGNPITSASDSQVNTATVDVEDIYGFKFISADQTSGYSTMGIYTPGTANWAVTSGFNVPFTDFTMLEFNELTMILIYVKRTYPSYFGAELWIAEQDVTSNQWTNNRLIANNTFGFRYPQASIVGDVLYITVQDMYSLAVSVITSTNALKSFNALGHVHVDGDELMPNSNWATFGGTIDGGSTPELWFYWIDYLSQTPRISYVTDYSSGNIQLSPSQTLDIPFAWTQSVSAMVKPDLQQAILLRTGNLTEGSQSLTAFTVVKLSSTVAKYCDESWVTWGPSSPPDQVVTNMSPAITSGIFDDAVTLTWVSALDGTLNTIAGSPWGL